MVKRSIPVRVSVPISDTARPKAAAISPLTGVLPLRTPTALKPQSTSIKSSGEPSSSTNGVTIGSDAMKMAPPNSPPSSEAPKAAPKARLASPFRAIGWPSRMVAWEPDPPGTAISTEGKVLAVFEMMVMPNIRAMHS